MIKTPPSERCRSFGEVIEQLNSERLVPAGSSDREDSAIVDPNLVKLIAWGGLFLIVLVIVVLILTGTIKF
jgi:hypothetical protein